MNGSVGSIPIRHCSFWLGAWGLGGSSLVALTVELRPPPVRAVAPAANDYAITQQPYPLFR